MVFVISRIKNLPEAAYAVSGLHLLLQINNIDYQTEFTFDDCLNNKTSCKLRFDFAILKNNKLEYLIEYHGVQHYKENSLFFKHDSF